MIRYVPHHAVTSHPVLVERPGLAASLFGREVKSIISSVRNWRWMEETGSIYIPVISFIRAVEWDLMTHYDATEEDFTQKRSP